MRTDDESTDKYYISQWTSKPYKLQEDKEMKGYTSLVTVYVGDIVCDAVFSKTLHLMKRFSLYLCIKGIER